MTNEKHDEALVRYLIKISAVSLGERDDALEAFKRILVRARQGDRMDEFFAERDTEEWVEAAQEEGVDVERMLYGLNFVVCQLAGVEFDGHGDDRG